MTRGALLTIGAVALAARLLHLQVADELFHGLFLDGEYYAERARAIRDGGSSDTPYLLAPLYPYLLAPFIGADGELAVGAVRVLQALLGAGTAVLTAATAAHVGTRAAGWVGGLTVATFGPAIHYESFVLVAGPQAFFLSLALWVLVRAERPRAFLGCGIALGLSAGLRPTGLAIAAAIAAGGLLVAARTRDWRGTALRVGALLAGVALVVLPFTLRNLAVSGEPVLLSANGGFNFWVGNHEGAGGTFSAPPGYDLAADPVGRTIACREHGAELDYTGASRWWRARALDDIAAAPGAWLGLLARKLLLFGHPTEIPQLGASFEWYRARAWTLANPIDARLLLILALCAPVVAFWRRGRDATRRLLWPLVVLAAYGAAIALFFVVGRYRAPALPAATVLAAVCVVDVLALLRGPAPRRGWLAVAAVALAFAASHALYVASFAPLAVRGSAGAEERQLGTALFEEGRVDESIAAFRASLEIRDDPLTRVNLANALAARRETAAASAEYERALQDDPHSALAWYNFGNLLRVQVGAVAEAERAYRRALELRPTMAEAHLNLGAALMDLNRPAEAAASLERALEHAPPDAPWRASAEQVLEFAKQQTR